MAKYNIGKIDMLTVPGGDSITPVLGYYLEIQHMISGILATPSAALFKRRSTLSSF